jgi:hypothetical protein
MILGDAAGADAELQVGAVAVRESRTLLKTFRDGGRAGLKPGLIRRDSRRPRMTGPGRSSPLRT